MGNTPKTYHILTFPSSQPTSLHLHLRPLFFPTQKKNTPHPLGASHICSPQYCTLRLEKTKVAARSQCQTEPPCEPRYGNGTPKNGGIHGETILVDAKKCWTKSGHSSYNHNLCSKYQMNSPAFYHWIKVFAVWGCLDALHTHVFRSATTKTPRNAFPTTCMNLPLRSLLQFPCWNPARKRTCQHNVGWLAFTTKDPSQKNAPENS